MVWGLGFKFLLVGSSAAAFVGCLAGKVSVGSLRRAAQTSVIHAFGCVPGELQPLSCPINAYRYRFALQWVG